MKILSIGNFGKGWDGSICDEEHIASALEDLGHDVERWQREDIAFGSLPGKCDFVLISQWDGYPEGMTDMLKKATGAPIVYWAFDYQEWGQEWHERLIKGADLYLSKRIADSKYPNWQWLTQDFAPSFLDKAPRFNKDIDILFTGSYLPWATERTDILKAVDKKFNLVVHSFTPDQWREQGLKNVNGPIMDDGLPGLIARAKVNLSIDHTIEAGYWSDRNAQIMCCGGFVLSRYVPLMSSIFRSYIGYFYNEKTCFDSLEHWVNADEDRENTAGWGYDYAQENLKVADRVDDLLNIVQGIL